MFRIRKQHTERHDVTIVSVIAPNELFHRTAARLGVYSELLLLIITNFYLHAFFNSFRRGEQHKLKRLCT